MTDTKLRNTWASMNKAIMLLLIAILVFNIMWVTWNGENQEIVENSIKIAITFAVIDALSVMLYCSAYPDWFS